MFSFLTIALVVIAVVLLNPVQSNDNEISTGEHILLLTAHPDDECMFFAPTVQALLKQNARLFSLCLSTGNSEGLGELRRKELDLSLETFGIQDSDRYIVDHPELQDNITIDWDPEIVASVTKPFVKENAITVILTFDRHGISGHPNHKALPRGAHLLLREFHGTLRLFTLISVSLPEKYISILAPILANFDLYVSSFIHRSIPITARLLGINGTMSANSNPVLSVYVAGFSEYMRALVAMKKHESQLVWFRWLYVSFSRYLWVNEWQETKLMT